MTCFCLCHNSYAVKNGTAPEHSPEQCECQRVEDPTLKARVEITEQIEEQLLQKSALEEALRSIIEKHAACPPDIDKFRDFADEAKDIAVAALEPKALCLACRKLSPSFPCVHCGKEHT